MGSKASILERAARRTFRRAGVCVFGALLWAIATPTVQAGFIGYYDPANFTLTDNSLWPNSSMFSPDVNTLVLTGSSDGTGLLSTTDLTIIAGGTGVFQFDYMFANLLDLLPPDLNSDPPIPPPDPWILYGAYLHGTSENNVVESRLADALGGHGSVSLSVTAGDVIGFRIGQDNTGGPGVLTITNFSAPVPEPGSFSLLLVAGLASIGVAVRRRTGRR